MSGRSGITRWSGKSEEQNVLIFIHPYHVLGSAISVNAHTFNLIGVHFFKEITENHDSKKFKILLSFSPVDFLSKSLYV